MDYIASLLPIALVFALMSCGGVLLWGYYRLPLMSLAGAAGIGGYSAAILSLNGVSPIVAVLGGGASAGVFGMAVGLLVSDVDRDAAVVSTFAIQICLDGLFLNATPITGGAMGMPGIPTLVDISIVSEWRWIFPVAFLLVLALVVASFTRLSQSLHGSLLRAAAENPYLVAIHGVSLRSLSVKTLFVAHVPLGLAGGLYAHHVGYIHPTNFGVMESVFVLAIVAAGGTRRYFGAVIAALVLVAAPETLRFIHFDAMAAEKIRALFVGVVLVAVAFVGFGSTPEDRDRRFAPGTKFQLLRRFRSRGGANPL